MKSLHCATAPAASGLGQGLWRRLLRTRLLGRAEPLFVDAGGLRSAASLWSGAQRWAQLLRSRADHHRVLVRQADRLALLQVLVAVLWDGRVLQIEMGGAAVAPGDWCLDGQQVAWDGQAMCDLHDGGWPDLAGPATLSALDMLAHAPAHGAIAVGDQQVSHADLWQDHGAPLGTPPRTRSVVAPVGQVPDLVVLEAFDLAALTTPHAVLNDLLLPLLRCTEVWERAAWPAA